jgi:hypothetical protein
MVPRAGADRHRRGQLGRSAVGYHYAPPNPSGRLFCRIKREDYIRVEIVRYFNGTSYSIISLLGFDALKCIFYFTKDFDCFPGR